jgi:hypothetical protein
MPTSIRVKKNKMDHACGTGRRLRASGYAIKANPAPVIDVKYTSYITP